MINITRNQSLDNFEAKINTEIQITVDKITSILKVSNTIELLSRISFERLTSFDPKEGYTCTVTVPHIEYLIGLLLNKNYDFDARNSERINTETITEIQKSTELLFGLWGLSNYARKAKTIESTDHIDKAFFEASIISSYGSIRGYSWYSPIMDIQYSRLFKPLDDWMTNNVGFTIGQAFEIIQTVIPFYNDRISKLRDKIYASENGVQILLEIGFRDIMLFTFEDLLQYNTSLNKSVLGAFLDRFSSKFGMDYNDNFTFPSDRNCFRQKPIIKYGDMYFVPNPSSISWILREELENDLKEDKDIWGKYLDNKSMYLENEVARIFKRVLHNADIYQSLYYVYEGKQFELDGLFIFDNNIFLVESKSGIFHQSAQRGGIKRLEKVVYNNIEYAYLQAKRAREYIESNDTPIFANKNGKIILTINKSRYRRIFLINVVLEYFADLSTGLDRLKKAGIYTSNEYPWTVALSDLEIIADFMEFPSQFLHYIYFRYNFNNKRVTSNEWKLIYELDLLGFYLTENSDSHEGYYISQVNEQTIVENIIYDREDSIFCKAPDYSKIFNEFYNTRLLGIHVEPIRKSFNIDFHKMLIQIESYHQYGYTNFIIKFLDMSLNEQNKLMEHIYRLCEMVKKDGLDHNISLPFLKTTFDTVATYGITIEASLVKWRSVVLENLQTFCIIKRYQQRADEWIGMCCFVDDHRNLVNNFISVEGNTGHDPVLEDALHQVPLKKLKIGRNSPCPCGSGKKYKKCHGWNKG